MTPLVPPTIHLNGTSKEELVELRLKVISVLQDLDRVMADAAPHARDYPDVKGRPLGYPLKGAIAAWNERRAMVEQFLDELQREALKISMEGL